MVVTVFMVLVAAPYFIVFWNSCFAVSISRGDWRKFLCLKMNLTLVGVNVPLALQKRALIIYITKFPAAIKKSLP
jgi:hypothetical protein